MKLFKRLFTVILCVILTFSMANKVYAASLTYWYSNSSMIGKWSYSSITVWYSKLNNDGNFAFLSGLTNGKNVWNSALNLSVSVSSGYTSAPIKYYGGTKDQIDALFLFEPVATTDLGSTYISESTSGGTHSYNGSTKYWFYFTQMRGYVVSRSDLNYNNYIKTCSHELGHALGWWGHPSTYQSTWIMQPGILENTTLALEEKRHLSQIY